MTRIHFISTGLVCAALSFSFTGCKPGASSSQPVVAGKFTIVDTMTDNTDRSLAKRNAETAVTVHPDLAGVCGLWSYNTPQALEGLKNKGKLGQVKVFAFDEEIETLAAIEAGNCEGTIVQQPFEFGYQSMVYLKAVADGKTPGAPASVPVQTITKDGVSAFKAKCLQLKAEADAAVPAAPAGAPKFCFVINNNSDFWSYARAGLRKAERELGVVAEFQAPPTGAVPEQNRILESLVLKKAEYKGVAISPVKADTQTEVLNATAAALPLITHDSDAPASKRLAYVGTSNVEAGRMLGKLVKERLPNGGKLVILVGSMDASNAQERRQGLIEELSK